MDGEVVSVCRDHLPWTATALDDPRVRVRLGDGAAFAADQPGGAFDAVLVDAPDPVGHAAVLFGCDFYRECQRILADNGVLAVQSDSPFIQPGITRQVVARLVAEGFPTVRVCFAVVPTYAGSLWTFTVASLGADPAGPPPEHRAADLQGCRYWTPALHQGAFALPAFAERLVFGSRATAAASGRP